MQILTRKVGFFRIGVEMEGGGGGGGGGGWKLKIRTTSRIGE